MDMIEEIQDIIATRVVPKYKRSTPQSMRDHTKVLQRVDKNGVKVDYVGEFLDRLFGKRIRCSILLNIATRIADMTRLKIDRLAKRSRSALLCWYAENWNTVLPYLYDFRHNESKQESRLISSPILDEKPLKGEESVIDPGDIHQLLNFHEDIH